MRKVTEDGQGRVTGRPSIIGAITPKKTSSKFFVLVGLVAIGYLIYTFG